MTSKIGVIFGEYHSYKDWRLRLKDVKIEMPDANTEYVQVPGMNGYLDLTDAQFGGVTYGMRKLTFTFDARDCSYVRWAELLSRISGAIHGKKLKIIQDIDAGYYYLGRCSVNTNKSNEILAEVVIECYCDPYKLEVSSSDEPWKWDQFSFIDGKAYSTSDITINSKSVWQEILLRGYAYNDTLTIISNAHMSVKYQDCVYSIYPGANTMYDIILCEGDNKLYFLGTGKITIAHKGGRL